MKKKTVWTASVLGAAAFLAAFCLLAPRSYPVPADTTVGTRSIRYEDRPETAAEIIVARYFLNQITGDFNEMKNLLPNTEADRITLKNEKEAFLKGESMETYLIRSITTLDREQYIGDNRAFSYPGAEHKARQENLKDYVVVHVEFYQKWNNKAESHAPQWNSGECGRNFLVGKKALDKNYKIYDFGMMM